MNTTPASLLDDVRCRADAQSWRRLCALYQPWLRGWLNTHLLQSADVDDLVQEVMAVVVKEIPDFQHTGRTGAFRCWLRGIVANRLREFWRKNREQTGDRELEAKLQYLEDEGSPLQKLWDAEHDQQVVNHLLQVIAADFEPKTWQAFRAFMLEGKKAAAVAAELGISEGAVWTAKSHVLKRLRAVAKDLLDT